MYFEKKKCVALYPRKVWMLVNSSIFEKKKNKNKIKGKYVSLIQEKGKALKK